MSLGHRAVIEAGPATIRRLCCGGAESADAAAALEWIDDPVGLVDGQPVTVPELLREALTCSLPVESIELIHPSWWPARRVQLLAAAARGLTGEVVSRSRATVLGAAVVVEIAAGLVAVAGADSADMFAEPRIGSPDEVADAVAGRIRAGVWERPGAVVIDVPVGVGGAPELSTMIEERLRPGVRATVIDQLLPLRRKVDTSVADPAPVGGRLRLAPAGVVAGVLALALVVRPDIAPNPEPPGTTYLVESRVAVQVPQGWATRRVTAGPGSARVEVVSPTDPQLVLHVTQAPVAGATLTAIAEPLRQALQRADVETPGVFIDFDPVGTRAGRPAVTYREIRDGHQVDWAVLVDRAVRIGIGCQSEPGGEEALRAVCEQAVRSAHAVS